MPARANSEKLEAVDAVYTEQGQPVCPNCFSKPSIQRRVDRAREGRRGAKLHVSDVTIDVNGKSLRLLRTLYPCANAACRTNLILYSAPTVSAMDERIAAFRAARMLTPGQRHDYATGTHDRDGVWRQASLF